MRKFLIFVRGAQSNLDRTKIDQTDSTPIRYGSTLNKFHSAMGVNIQIQPFSIQMLAFNYDNPLKLNRPIILN